jgi:hypothetical protein
MIDGVRRQIKALEQRAIGDDPWVAADMSTLASELNAAVDRTVGRLRAQGSTWQDIGFQFGTTKQGAFNKWNANPSTVAARNARTAELAAERTAAQAS